MQAFSVWAVALSILIAIFAQPASAQTSTPKPRTPAAIAKAKDHFERALESYREGAYRTAINELELALELDPDGKDLVYNLGLVYEKLGEVDKAIAQFERYLEMEAEPSEAERARVIIRRLEGARAEIARKQAQQAGPHDEREPAPSVASKAAPASPEPEPRGERGRFDGWVIAAGGAALAATLVGTVFGIRALATRPSSDEATGTGTTATDLEQRAADAHELAVVADVAFGIALASLGAGAALYFFRDAEPATGGGRRLGARLEVSF